MSPISTRWCAPATCTTYHARPTWHPHGCCWRSWYRITTTLLERPIMTKAIRISAVGGPEVMEYVDVEVGEPGAGEARVRQAACGLNYIDVYFRTGAYPQPLPAGLGMEGAGTVEAVARFHMRDAR